MIRFRHGEATDVGQVRQVNEDGFLAADPLFAVADGMGGHRAGEVASATALDVLRSSDIDSSADALMAAVEEANLTVFRRAADEPELYGMGTTLCAIGPVAADGIERIGIVNVGDSRVYLWNDGILSQITEDHSLVEAMVRGGQLTAEEAASHPRRNVVTRALGIEPVVDVDCWALTPAPGDRLLLCSDGLFGEVSDDTISGVLGNESDPMAVAEQLVRLANEAGGRDNITVVVVDPEVVQGDTHDAVAPVTDRVERLSVPSDDLLRIGESLEPPPPPRSPYLPPAGSIDSDPTVPLPVVESPPLPAAVSASSASPAPPVQAAPAPPVQAEPARQRRLTWRVVLFILAVLVVLAVAVGAVVLSSKSDDPGVAPGGTSSTITTATTPG